MGIGAVLTATGPFSEHVRAALDPSRMNNEWMSGDVVTADIFRVDFSSGSAALADALGVDYRGGKQPVDAAKVDVEALRAWCKGYVYEPLSNTAEHFLLLRDHGFAFTYETE